MAEILKGAPVAAALTEKTAARAAALNEIGITPTLALIRIGERDGDLAYESGIIKRAAKAGVEIRHYNLAEDATKEQLLAAIREINEDPSIDGCLLFRPLPDREMEEAACAALKPEKDVDAMTQGSLASVFTGKGAGFAPCTAQAVMEMLAYYNVPVEGKRAVVIGRSLVIGRPVAMLLQQKNATVTMCHTRTADLPGECRRADILVVAAGKAGVVGAEHVSEGQVVIDVGIHVGPDGRMSGDVSFDEVEPVVSAVSPVPGGVGNVTTAVLCKHVVEAAEASV